MFVDPGPVPIGSVSVTLLGTILYIVLRLFALILIARIVIEMIQSFSRNFQPPRWFIMVAEPLFVITDPPVKALRRVIPPLRLGNVALDLSVIVLFIVLSILTSVVFNTMVV
ncbi:hypothetical protein A605_09425 [Corynebacterium halotolerans YIM 70093 = DSM 44683]|uniref:YggT family protein n=1 Tax=Corynebacterium halotolerans YIM 70093 = DSM 44683 TaxID=1121362 RepID=M1NTT4_9CORY|nr:hypothetical protein A605_09425 [Corynebacterium halotolerans YIM 70093 = DSM 44683]